MNNESILAMVIAWLGELVPGYPAATKVPTDLPDKFITVERGGGERRAMVLDMADLVIDVYDKESEVDCSAIADFIADKIPSLVEESDNITHADVQNVFQINDTQRGYNRYEIACSVYHRR